MSLPAAEVYRRHATPRSVGKSYTSKRALLISSPLVAPTSLGLRERSGATLTLCEQPKATAPCSSVDIYERYRDRFSEHILGGPEPVLRYGTEQGAASIVATPTTRNNLTGFVFVPQLPRNALKIGLVHQRPDQVSSIFPPLDRGIPLLRSDAARTTHQ